MTFASSLIGALCVFVACSTPPTQPAKVMATRDIVWVVDLAQRPQGDPDRECLRNALQTGYALLAFKDGGYDDRSIRAALLQGAGNDELRNRRQADFAEWTRTREPAAVGASHLRLCLQEQGNDLVPTDSWLRCMLAVEPASVFSIYRRTGRSLVEAVRAVTPLYPINTDAADIAELGRQVYGMPQGADDVELREEIFVGCLRENR